MDFVKIENVSKIYVIRNSHHDKIVANNNINLHVKKGDVVGIFGDNGSGKTTLIKQIVGIIKPTYGQIRVNDIEPTSKNFPKEIIGYMPQRSYTFWDLTILEILYITCHIKGYIKSQCRYEAEKFIKDYGIQKWADNLFYTLSIGIQRITIFGTATIGSPSLIVLDEPSAGLDETKVEKIKEYIYNKKNEGVTVIIISHGMDFLESVCNSMYSMCAGSLNHFRNECVTK